MDDVFKTALTSGSGLAATVYYYDGSFGTRPASRRRSEKKEKDDG
jgi:hypothetical protein